MTNFLMFLSVVENGAPDSDLFLGMPLPALLSLLATGGVAVGALVTALVKKFRTPADDREDKVMVLDASDRLIARFETLLAASDEKHAKEIKELSAKVDELETDVKTMRKERFTLVSALIKITAIARKYGGREAEYEIRSVELPEDVTV